MKIDPAIRLYGILDLGYTAPEEIESATNALLAGGVQILQLRAKNYAPAAVQDFAFRMLPICRKAGVPLIINDHIEVAKATEADGVHLGQDDASVAEARRQLHEGALVGKSTHSIEQAAKAKEEQPDYIGFGPLFATPTKPDYHPVGLADVEKVHQLIDLPIFCIGGIKLENLPKVLAAGARRVVIVSGLLLADDIAGRTRECRQFLDAP